MQKKSYHLLLHPIFLLSVLLLLLNDFYLKPAYHNWFTGKLSDFSGLFAFAVFLTAVSGIQKLHIIIFVVLSFFWWKSPLSAGFILFLNQGAGIHVSRVVDYTDLWALIVVPFIYYLQPAAIAINRVNHFFIRLSAIISFFAFCATSLPYREFYYYPSRENEIRFNEIFYSAMSEPEILKRFGADKTGYQKDTVRYYRISEELDLYYRLRDSSNSSLQWVPLSNKTDSLLFIKKKNQNYITIPFYILNGDSLINLQMEIKASGQKNKPTMIKIESFQTNNKWLYEDFPVGKSGKHYKKHFKSLFRK